MAPASRSATTRRAMPSGTARPGGRASRHDRGPSSRSPSSASSSWAASSAGRRRPLASEHVPVTAIVGAQWGDEGKGKITDLLAQEADLVIRFQGGNNAGHTVVNEGGEFKLHLVPSGIFNPNALCVLGPGTVVDLAFLCRELEQLE